MKNHLLQSMSSKVKMQFNYGDIIDYQCQIEPSYYFLALNEHLPNVITFDQNLKSEEFFAAVIEKYQPKPGELWQYKAYSRAKKKVQLNQFMLQIQRELILFCELDDNSIKILYADSVEMEKVEALCQLIEQYFEEDMIQADSRIFLLYESRGLYLQDFKVKKYPMEIADNYNRDFLPIHETIINRLNQADDKGIVLLHGIPGTGKTSYIRYLTSLINKRMIYIPPEFAHKIASPEFLPLLIDNPNSIIIIEDSENIIEERSAGRNMSVANLLNVADGLLSDCLNIQILCTFNTHISKIDKALLRKGRLIASYEFKALEVPQAQKLSRKLGFETEITQPMTLSDIYNQKDQNYSNQQNGAKIGFSR